MRAIHRRLPSPAMIVACAALVVALGGVSYAAAVLPKNSVGTAQLKKKAVTGPKIKRNAVTGPKVKNGTLMAADFKAGQLPAGLQGPKGDPGPQGTKGDKGDLGLPGASGFTKYVVRFGPEVSAVAGAISGAEVSCSTGEIATGGGDYNGQKLFLTTSYPNGPGSTPTGWSVRVYNAEAATTTFRAYVVCAS